MNRAFGPLMWFLHERRSISQFCSPFWHRFVPVHIASMAESYQDIFITGVVQDNCEVCLWK